MLNQLHFAIHLKASLVLLHFLFFHLKLLLDSNMLMNDFLSVEGSVDLNFCLVLLDLLSLQPISLLFKPYLLVLNA